MGKGKQKQAQRHNEIAEKWLREIDAVCARVRPTTQLSVQGLHARLDKLVHGSRVVTLTDGMSRMVIRAAELPVSTGQRDLLRTAGQLNYDARMLARLTPQGLEALVRALEAMIPTMLLTRDGKLQLGGLCVALQNLISHDPFAIAATQSSQVIMSEMDRGRWGDPMGAEEGYNLKMMHTLLNALHDERITVLQPRKRRGWEVIMSGCSDVFQLEALLTPIVHPSGQLTPEEMAIVRGEVRQTQVEEPTTRDRHIQLLQLTAVQPDGTVNYSHDHWLWAEGVPADMLRFQQRRICIVARPTDAPQLLRFWHAGRIFSGLRASVVVVKELTGDEVDSQLAELAGMSQETRERAMALARDRRGGSARRDQKHCEDADTTGGNTQGESKKFTFKGEQGPWQGLSTAEGITQGERTSFIFKDEQGLPHHAVIVNPTNSYFQVLNIDLNGCGHCGARRDDVTLKSCTRCRVVSYCSKECQQAAWKVHKPKCIPYATRAQWAEDFAAKFQDSLQIPEIATPLGELHDVISYRG